MKKILPAALAVYLLASLLASVLVSVLPAPAADWLIEHRAPLLLVELASVTPSGFDTVFGAYGPDRHGRNIYGHSPDAIGQTVQTVFLWSPFNNYYDATFVRLDF